MFFLRYGMLEKSRFCDEFVGGRSYLDEKASVCAGIKGVYRVPPNGAHSHFHHAVALSSRFRSLTHTALIRPRAGEQVGRSS